MHPKPPNYVSARIGSQLPHIPMPICSFQPACPPSHHLGIFSVNPSPTMFLTCTSILPSPTLTSSMEPNLLPFVTQASDSSDSEEPIEEPIPPPMPSRPSYCDSSSNSATSAAAADATTHQQPPPTKRPLVQTGLFGLKAIPCSKRIPVRQFKKTSGSKVRSHTRKPSARRSRRSSLSLNAKSPSLPKCSILGAHVDPESAKLINSMLIQDKLDQCKPHRPSNPSPADS